MLEKKVARSAKATPKKRRKSHGNQDADHGQASRPHRCRRIGDLQGVRTTCRSGSAGALTNCGRAKADRQVASTTTGSRPSARSPRRAGSTQPEPVVHSVTRASRRPGPGRPPFRSRTRRRETLTSAGEAVRLPMAGAAPTPAQLDRCGKRPIVAAASAVAPPGPRMASRSMREPDAAKGGDPRTSRISTSGCTERERARGCLRKRRQRSRQGRRWGRRGAGRGGAGGRRDRRRADRLLVRSLVGDLAGPVPGILLSSGRRLGC